MYFLFNIMTWLKIKTVKESSLITLFSFWPTPRISWFIKTISLNLSFCVWWCSLNYWICNNNKISFEIFLFNFFFLFAKLYKFKRYLYFLHLFCLTLFFKYCELIAINICIPFCSSSFLILFEQVVAICTLFQCVMKLHVPLYRKVRIRLHNFAGKACYTADLYAV